VVEPDRPIITFLRLYADGFGESHIEVEDLRADLDPATSGRAQLMEGPASEFAITVVPPGWKRDWGPSRRRTLAVYAAGEGTVQSSDGDLRQVQPGVILLAEDTTGRGHRAEVIGDRPLAVIHIALSDAPAR
jgi:hypothetical protein